MCFTAALYWNHKRNVLSSYSYTDVKMLREAFKWKQFSVPRKLQLDCQVQVSDILVPEENESHRSRQSSFIFDQEEAFDF